MESLKERLLEMAAFHEQSITSIVSRDEIALLREASEALGVSPPALSLYDQLERERVIERVDTLKALSLREKELIKVALRASSGVSPSGGWREDLEALIVEMDESAVVDTEDSNHSAAATTETWSGRISKILDKYPAPPASPSMPQEGA